MPKSSGLQAAGEDLDDCRVGLDYFGMSGGRELIRIDMYNADTIDIIHVTTIDIIHVTTIDIIHVTTIDIIHVTYTDIIHVITTDIIYVSTNLLYTKYSVTFAGRVT